MIFKKPHSIERTAEKVICTTLPSLETSYKERTMKRTLAIIINLRGVYLITHAMAVPLGPRPI